MAVMAKASMPGRTKTRLVPPLTHDEAAALNTAFVRDAADKLLAAAALAEISGWIAYAPAGSEAFFRQHMPKGIALIEIVAPDLGECLFRAADTLLQAHQSVCLLNADSPTLPVGHLVTAAAALAASDDRIVLGPTADGGYYLIGMRHADKGLFRNIDWSTERVFSQTLARAGELGLAVYQLPVWYDVDDADSLRRVAEELLDERRPGPPAGVASAARWTRAYLADRLAATDLGIRLRSIASQGQKADGGKQ